MRVLMLGWEFPPHISGGLGTACLGLTQGLAQHDVEVLFVVPRAYGDEDAPHLDLIGLDGEVEEALPGGGVRRVARRIVHRARRVEVGAKTEGSTEAAPAVEVPPPAGGRISVLGIPSPLRPYLRARDYDDAVFSSEEHVAPSGRKVQVPAGDGGVDAWDTFTEEVAEEVRHAERPRPPRAVPFGGGYGPGLFDEVARYARAVVEAVAWSPST